MTFHLDNAAIGWVSTMPEVLQAAQEGVELIGLWPLTDAKFLDNDVKYAENLQVRLSQTIAALLTGHEVTTPDAEFVYEGANQIPGRPQDIVDALLAANDAYEMISAYSREGDTSVVMSAADRMGVNWRQDTKSALVEALNTIESVVQSGTLEGEPLAMGSDKESVNQRLALILVAFRTLLVIVCRESTGNADDAPREIDRGATPMVLYVNELCERLSIPRMYLSAAQCRHLFDVCVSDKNDREMTVEQETASLVGLEWKHHRDDILWDPEVAKKQAKEEDERKSKEALAAKFAHIPDDPNKPKVEL